MPRKPAEKAVEADKEAEAKAAAVADMEAAGQQTGAVLDTIPTPGPGLIVTQEALLIPILEEYWTLKGKTPYEAALIAYTQLETLNVASPKQAGDIHTALARLYLDVASGEVKHFVAATIGPNAEKGTMLGAGPNPSMGEMVLALDVSHAVCMSILRHGRPDR